MVKGNQVKGVQEIPDWARDSINGYISTEQNPKYKTLFRANLRKLATYLDSLGIYRWEDAKARQLYDFFLNKKHWQFRGVYDFFKLNGLEEIGLICNERNVKRTISYNIFPKDGYDIKDVVIATKKIVAKYKELSYSKSILSDINRAYFDLRLSLLVWDGTLTKKSSNDWLMETRYKRGLNTQTWRRALRILLDILEGKDLDESISIIKAKPRSDWEMPIWIKEQVEDYIQFRKENGIGKSALSMDYNSISYFARFIDVKGLNSFSELTPMLVKEYHVSINIHKTAEGKSAYNARIRKFLVYLSHKGLIKLNIPFALPCQRGTRYRPVTILDENQKKSIENYILSASTPIEIRNALIVGMGLYMGLRRSDVVGARLSDIDWEKQELSVMQQKTKVFVRLPIPTFLCNLAYKYITIVRPKMAHDETILIRPIAPFKRYCTGVCGNALGAILQSPKKESFHILRRTFASEMLRSLILPDIIAASLGHVGLKSVDSYITTDTKNLHKCMLEMEG